MATVTAGYNWVSGETVTPAKLNSTAAPTVVVADNEVTTAKILDATSTTTGVTNTKLRHSAALSVIGRSADSAGAPADIAAANDGEVFRRSGTAVGFGTVATAGIANAAVTPAKLAQPLTLATAQNTTSGTSIDFTGIPSWAKRITVMLNGVSTNGANNLLVQIGDSGGIENTGYVSTAFDRSDETQGTAGFILTSGNAAAIASSGLFICCLVGSNTWVGSSTLSRSDVGGWAAAGTKTLSGTLDRITLTTVNGTDTFDAGSVNIMYEG
jgi:hypothetical protein